MVDFCHPTTFTCEYSGMRSSRSIVSLGNHGKFKVGDIDPISPRQTLNSLEVISQTVMSTFMHQTEKQAGERRFAGNVNLLHLLS
jgi:hypothetical protein